MISTQGKLVLHVDNPSVVLGAIKTAKIKEVNGVQLLVMPHGADEVKILRNIGLNPPPIKLEFNYTGRHKPFTHQQKTVEFLVVTRRGFNLSDPGTGKTKAALWAAEYLRLHGRIKRVLILCPLSVLSVWEEECFDTVPHRSFCKLTGTKQKRLELLKAGSDICVINHDGFTTIHKELKDQFDLVILDEASAYKNAQTKRYKLFREATKAVPYLWLMTGTPVTKSPTDAYGLIKIINPTSFPGGFVLFREMSMTKVNMFKWVPKVDSKDFVYKHLQPAIRFKKEDCIDLPPLTYVNRVCELSEKQEHAFKLMKEKFIIERQNEEKITAANAAVKLLKLVQVACGVVKDNDGEHYDLDPKHRIETLLEILDEVGSKVIVFVPFIGVMELVERELTLAGWRTELVNGSTSEKERSRIFSDFQNGDLEVLVAHPKTAAHGLNLTRSSTIVWYGPVWSTEQYMQANARINRSGQKNKMTVYHIVSTPLERSIFRALWGEILMSNAILEQYENL